MKRWMTLLLTLAMLLTLLPTTALAAVGTGWNDDCRGNPSGNGYGKHNWVKQSEVPGNGCTYPGVAGYRCAYCGANATRETSAPGHSWGSWKTTKEATCTSQGEQTRTCSVCGQSETRKTDRSAHSWGGWNVTREATCAETGSRERMCQVCGEKQTESTEKLPHTWDEWQDIVPVTDHSSGTRRHTCGICGTEETEDIDPEGTLRRGARGEAVVSLQEGLICYGALTGGADGVFGPGTERAVKVVQEAEGLTVDGVAWPQTLAFTQHLFGDWQTLTPLTRTEDGLRQRVCGRCGVAERDIILAKPTYEIGQRGKPIEFIQEILGEMGYDVGTVDGIFGPHTEQAIEEWGRFRPDPVRPGKLRPFDVDHLVHDWVELLPEEEWIAACGEDTPVRLRLSVELVDTIPLHFVGETLTFNWTAVNDGPEDCKLGPILLTYGEGNTTKDVHSIFSYVMDIDGNLLQANGANSLSGTFSIQIKRENIRWWEQWWDSNGDLCVNFRALGISAATGKKWVSNTVTDHYSVHDDKRDIDEDLKLTARVCDAKPLYRMGDAVTVEVVITNETGVDLTDAAYAVYLETAEGYDEMGAGSAGDLAAGASVTRYAYQLLDYYDLMYMEEEYTRIYCEASATRPDGRRISAERFPLSIPVMKSNTQMSLTVEQISPPQEVYKVGDTVRFKWTLKNKIAQDVTLDSFWVESPSDERSVKVIRKGPIALPAKGTPLTGTYDLTLEESWLSDKADHNGGFLNGGRWCLNFNAAATPAGGPAGSVQANEVSIRLDSESAESALVLEVEQISPEKPFYEAGDEVTFAWRVTNVSPYDVVLAEIECTTPDEQGEPVAAQSDTLRGHGRDSVGGTHTVKLDDEWFHTGNGEDEGTWAFFFVAWANFTGEGLGSIRSNEVRFALPPEHYDRTLQLTVEQISPVKERYAPGEQVEFRWTLKNAGSKDLTLELVWMDWCDGTERGLSDDPLSLPGGKSLSDTWTLTLDPEHTVDDAWHLRFLASVLENASDSHRWYSNDVFITLEPDYGG